MARRNVTRMNAMGEVVAIHIASNATELPQPIDRVRVLPGHGLEGDRYAKGEGTFSGRSGRRDVSLIEEEALADFQQESGVTLSAAESRRNVLTRGVRLNDLVDCEFMVGAVRLRGLRLCEPCTHLQRLTDPATLRGLVHRGGLYAAILSEGEVAVGDRIARIDAAEGPS
jgi:MOSC domain-containing protein YiiM